MAESNERQAGKRKGPIRTCASCREEAEPAQMIRWVRAEDGQVMPDLTGRAFGRGAWTHPHPACLKDLKKALSRGFRAEVSTTSAEALVLLGQAGTHRVHQLLGAARRQNLLVYGADATGEAWYRGDLALILVAQDARSAATAGYVAEAITQGCAASWGTKEQLGHLFTRPEVGVVGVRDRGLARGLFGAIAMALLVPRESSQDSSRTS